MDAFGSENYLENDVNYSFPFYKKYSYGDSSGTNEQNNALSFNRQTVSSFDDLTLFQDDINDLVEIMSSSPNQNSSISYVSLDNIPLTETTIMQHIDRELNGRDGILMRKSQQNQKENNPASAVVRCPPMQLLQVVKYPALKNLDNISNSNNRTSKRKQCFCYPREDRCEFYSDDEKNQNIGKKIDESLELDYSNIFTTSSVKKQKFDANIQNSIEKIDKQVKIPPEKEMKTSQASPQTCPKCEKTFKRISSHKCKLYHKKAVFQGRNHPLSVKCFACKHFFKDEKSLEEHLFEKHSQQVCKICKFVSTNVQGLKIHSLKCNNK